MADKEAVSLAGRVLSLGNPFTDGDRRDEIRAHLDKSDINDLEAFLSPYFDASMSLAGHILGDAAEQSPVAVKTALEQSEVLTIDSSEIDLIVNMVTADATIALLKGMFPAGASMARIAILLGTTPSESREVTRTLKEQGFIRIDDDGTAYATNEAVANKAIQPMAWPKGAGR